MELAVALLSILGTHARALMEGGRKRADVAGLLGISTSTLRRALKA